MGFAFGALGLGLALVSLVAAFTQQAWWVFAFDLGLSVFALWEVYGTVRKNAALALGYLLLASTGLILLLRNPWFLALGNFLLGVGFILASAKYHYHHPELYGPGDIWARAWEKLVTHKPRPYFSEEGEAVRTSETDRAEVP